MESEMQGINQDLDTSFRLRIGVNTGAVVAGVIGASRFAYDLWGDTVNVASRMESQGDPGRIQVTRAVVEGAGGQYAFEPAGSLDVRGRGKMEVFSLTGTVSLANRR
jgi:adenylate cyclase